MGFDSFVTGYIEMRGGADMEQTKQAINSFEFDHAWPFSNIFWCDSPAQYASLVGIAGCYKQVEQAWSEWLWKFSQLLSRLEAIEARVTLDSIGSQRWELQPEVICSGRGNLPDTLIGQKWFITKAPEDFYMGTWCEFDEHSKCDKFVERWPLELDEVVANDK